MQTVSFRCHEVVERRATDRVVEWLRVSHFRFALLAHAVERSFSATLVACPARTSPGRVVFGRRITVRS
jgi:hypothetical protein